MGGFELLFLFFHCLIICDFLLNVVALVIVVVLNVRVGALEVGFTHHVGRAEGAYMGRWTCCTWRWSKVEVRRLHCIAELRALTPIVDGVDAAIIARDILVEHR